MCNKTTFTLTEAKELLSILLKCDPLVGDVSCHIHAVFLLLLCQKIQRQIQAAVDAAAEVVLPVSKAYQEACVLLTEANHSITDQVGLMIKPETNIDIPSLQKFNSSSKKMARVAEAREIVATEVFSFLRSYYHDMQDFFSANLKNYLMQENFLYLSFSRKRIPILPFYMSCKIMFDILAREKLLLIIKLKRLSMSADNSVPELVAEETLFYRCDQMNHFELQDKSEIADGQFGLVVNMYSYLPDKTHGVESCFDQLDSKLFFQEFSQLSILKLIMMCAAGHAQASDMVKGNTLDLQRDFDIEQQSCEVVTTDDVDGHHNCSTVDFLKYLLEARRYSVFSPKKVGINKRPPIQVNHVKIGGCYV